MQDVEKLEKDLGLTAGSASGRFEADLQRLLHAGAGASSSSATRPNGEAAVQAIQADQASAKCPSGKRRLPTISAAGPLAAGANVSGKRLNIK